jgi:predicted dehydrogenase
MTGRHEITSLLTRKLVGDSQVFGNFESAGTAPGIEIASVHHLEKTVNGAPLRRPAWFFDVHLQGDGIADIPTHMVDQAQRLVAACGAREASGSAPELLSARRSATRVPLALFARVTGEAEFPPEIRPAVAGSELLYESNATVSFRLAGVTVALDTRWDLTIPPGGGDAHRTVIRGTRAEIRIEQGPATGFARKLSVLPRGDQARARASLEKAVGGWQGEHPGVSLSADETGWEIHVPRNLDAGHESHFPLVLAEFLSLVDGKSAPPTLMTDTLAKYVLLAQAAAAAGPLATSSRP